MFCSNRTAIKQSRTLQKGTKHYFFGQLQMRIYTTSSAIEQYKSCFDQQCLILLSFAQYWKIKNTLNFNWILFVYSVSALIKTVIAVQFCWNLERNRFVNYCFLSRTNRLLIHWSEIRCHWQHMFQCKIKSIKWPSNDLSSLEVVRILRSQKTRFYYLSWIYFPRWPYWLLLPMPSLIGQNKPSATVSIYSFALVTTRSGTPCSVC